MRAQGLLSPSSLAPSSTNASLLSLPLSSRGRNGNADDDEAQESFEVLRDADDGAVSGASGLGLGLSLEGAEPERSGPPTVGVPSIELSRPATMTADSDAEDSVAPTKPGAVKAQRKSSARLRSSPHPPSSFAGTASHARSASGAGAGAGSRAGSSTRRASHGASTGRDTGAPQAPRWSTSFFGYASDNDSSTGTTTQHLRISRPTQLVRKGSDASSHSAGSHGMAPRERAQSNSGTGAAEMLRGLARRASKSSSQVAKESSEANGSWRSSKSLVRPALPTASSSNSQLEATPSLASVLSDSESMRTISGAQETGAFLSVHSTESYQPGPSSPIYLQDTSQGFLEAILEYLYTADESMVDTFAFLYDEDDSSTSMQALTAEGMRMRTREEKLEKLQQDLNYMWRSKLFADIKIVLEDADAVLGLPAGQAIRSIPDAMSVLSLPIDMEEDPEDEVTSFSAHRFMLASRSPYFAAQLLTAFSDQRAATITLPSPPFTPAALHFALGFLYSGTLSFSNRKFDLATAFQLWRAGAYLGMQSLQDVVSALIAQEFCHDFTCATGPPALPGPQALGTPCKTCAKRVPRALAFASCADVHDAPLLAAARRAVSGPNFGAYWHKDVGNLDDAGRDVIAAAVGRRLEMQPAECIGAARQLALVSARIEVERRLPWVEALRSMVEVVEGKVRVVLEAKLEMIVETSTWLALIDGAGLSSDVLEKILSLLVGALNEKRAAATYQTLVGQVLLREEDAPQGRQRQLIEDARTEILRYLKRRWVSIRASGGFDRLEKWALKEIADELDVKVEELRNTALKPDPILSRTGLKQAVVAKGSMLASAPASSRPAIRDGEREPGPINLRAAAVNRSAAKVATSSRNTLTASSAPKQTRSIASTRSPSSSSASSAARTASPATTRPSAASPIAAVVKAGSSTAKSVVTPKPSSTSLRSTAGSSMRSSSKTSIVELTPTKARFGRSDPAASSPTPRAAEKRRSLVQSAAPMPSSSSKRSEAASLRSAASTGSLRPSGSKSSELPPSAASSPSRPSSPANTASDLLASLTQTRLAHGIPCVVAPMQAGLRRPPRVRATVRYIGPVAGRDGSWLGVEVPAPLPAEFESSIEAGFECIRTDGELDGTRYFELSTQTRSAGQDDNVLDSESDVEAETRRKREARARRIRDLIATSSKALDSASDSEGGSSPSIARESKRKQRTSSTLRSTGETAASSIGLFIRPEDVLWVEITD